MLNRPRILLPAVIITFTSLITLSACSSGDDDTSGSGGSGSGATPGTGGTGTGTGGSTSNAGTGNSAGSGNSQPFPTLADCDAVKALTVGGGACSQLGCHKGVYASAKLDLTPNAGFVGRVKDVIATHTDIPCADGTVCGTIPSTCPTGDKLIDSSNVNNSWMLHKLQMTATGCGDSMPPAGSAIDDAGRACIIELVKTIAAMK